MGHARYLREEVELRVNTKALRWGHVWCVGRIARRGQCGCNDVGEGKAVEDEVTERNGEEMRAL